MECVPQTPSAILLSGSLNHLSYTEDEKGVLPPLSSEDTAYGGTTCSSGPLHYMSSYEDARFEPSARNLEIMSASMMQSDQSSKRSEADDFYGGPINKRWHKICKAVMLLQQGYRLRECWDEDDAMMQSESIRMSTIFSSTPLYQDAETKSGRSENSPSQNFADRNIVEEAWLSMVDPRRQSRTRALEHVDRPRWRASCEVKLPIWHPISLKRAAWTIFGVALLVFDMINLTMSVFDAPTMEWTEFIETMACVYWTADLGVTFITAIYLNGELVRSHRIIARDYFRTWFLFDFGLVISQWVIASVGSSGQRSGSSAFRALRVARYIRLLRCAKLSRFWSHLLESTNSVLLSTLVRGASYLLIVVLWVHVSACFWFWLGTSTSSGWAHQSEVYETYPLNYMISVHWAAAQLQGNVDVYPTLSVIERAFAAAHIVISVIVLALFVSKLTSILHHLETFHQQMNKLEHNTRQYLDDHKISMELSSRVRKYVEWKQAMDSKSRAEIPEHDLMLMLPVNLRRSVLDEARTPVISKSPVFLAFSMMHQEFYSQLCCDAFESRSHLPGDNVFRYGMSCTHMFFVVGGKGTYLKYGMVMRALMGPGRRNNDHHSFMERLRKERSQLVPQLTPLCEAVLWTAWTHVGDFTPMTQVTLLALDVASFIDLVMSVPSVPMALHRHACDFVAAMDSEDVSDLYTSTQLFEDQRAAEARRAQGDAISDGDEEEEEETSEDLPVV